MPASAEHPPAALHSVAAPSGSIDPFRPRRYLSNPHLQTIAGNYLPRHANLPAAEPQLVEVAPAENSLIASSVLCHSHWQPANVRRSRPTAILVHGLEGSSRSQYILGNAAKLWRSGANIIRMNMRNCGGTETLSPTLYHSGLSSDVLAVLRFFVAREHLESISLVGYSMGGNLVLKLAGELGIHPPPQLRAVIGVSPALDLGPSADALHAPSNRIYEWKFLRSLLKGFARKAELFPDLYDPARARHIRSLRDFDEHITAPCSGFTGADDYYFRASAARVLDRISVPTLILHAHDDPFIRITAESCAAITANPSICLRQTSHGGHCAFLAEPDPLIGYDGYWAEHTLLHFLLQHA